MFGLGPKVTLSDLWYQLSNNVRALILLLLGGIVLAALLSYAIFHTVDRGLIITPECSTGATWPWAKLPIFVVPISGGATADPEWREPFADAMRRFPIVLALPAVSSTAELGAGSSGIVTIEVVPAVMIPLVCHDVPEGHGCTRLVFRGCEIVKAWIFIPEEIDPWARAFVISHEIGHALGLDHDNDRGSIMHEVVPRSDAFELRPSDWTRIIETSKSIAARSSSGAEWMRSCVILVDGMEWIRDEPRCRDNTL